MCWFLRTVVLSFSSLHPLRSILFLPLNSQLVCRRRGRLQLPYSPLHRPLRLWFHMAHDHQFDVSLSNWSCCFSLLHIHVVVPCAPWDFVSFQLWYATLHSVRTATMDQSGFFLELVDTVVPELAVQETLPSERTRLRLGCGPRKRIGGCRR